MGNYISDHEKYLVELLNKPDIVTKEQIYLHEKQILHLQQERKIHLIITLFIGLFALISVYATILTKNLYLLAADLLLIVLFIPYIFHYRYLENLVQKWYKMSLDLTKKLKN